MTRTLGRLLIIVFAVLGLGACAIALWFTTQGISARRDPGAIETAVARRLRAAAIPSSASQQRNPVAASADALKDGMEHFADHCAVCHGNNGSGDTMIGSRLYPRAPDMRQASTQQLTDGALFYIIENGVKLTGMPAFSEGTPEGVGATWNLVQFIRHLPSVTAAELKYMEELNPKPFEEWRQMDEQRRLLRGKGEQSSQRSPKPHTHKHKQ
jgi:mono/diheme cytochrome c family protein